MICHKALSSQADTYTKKEIDAMFASNSGAMITRVHYSETAAGTFIYLNKPIPYTESRRTFNRDGMVQYFEIRGQGEN